MQEMWLKLDQSKDLFDYWNNELQLRKEFRKNFNTNHLIKVYNHEQIDFIYRSLYLTNRKYDFFIILTANLNQNPALNWFKKCKLELKTEFLEFMPWYLSHFKPPIEQLQFLVHIYSNELDNFYVPLLELLSAEQCQYLSSRSANSSMRNLLKMRQKDIEKKQRQMFYGLDVTKNLLPYLTIHGDKIKIILQAITMLDNLNTTLELSPEEEYFNQLLQVAQTLFEIGLINDCLYLLLEIYNHYEKNNNIVDMIEDERMVKYLNKLVRRVLPLYALHSNPESFNFCLGFYNRFFPRLTPDIASVTYLKLYEILTINPSNLTSTLLNLHQEILSLKQMRPNEIPLLLDYENSEGLSASRFTELCKLAETKISSLPHESFITLEFLRFLIRHEFISGVNKNILAVNYLKLFKWMPSSLFINEEIIEELLINTTGEIREQLEKTYRLISYYKDKPILLDIKEKPELFKSKKEEIRRIILTGKYLGVL